MLLSGFIIVGGIAACILSLVIDEREVAAFSLLLVGTYLACVCRDCAQVLSQLNDVVLRSQKERSRWNARHGFFSAAGQALSNRTEEIGCRLHFLSGEFSTQHEKAPEIPVQVEVTEHDFKAVLNAFQSEDFFRQTLAMVQERFRCFGCAVIIPSMSREQECSEPQVLSHHCGGARFNRELIRFYSLYLQSGEGAMFGYRDGFESDSILGEFSLFGFRYMISYPFAYTLQGRLERGVLWLGYSAEKTPLRQEVLWAQELAQKMSAELQNRLNLQKISGRLVEAEEVSQQKSDFLTHMSHDLRSPINNIRAVLSLLRVEVKDSESAELLDVALGNCDSVTEMVETILDFSKHQAGRLSASPRVFDVSITLKTALEGFVAAAKLKALDLHFEGPSESFVFADVGQMKRVFSNIIGNAVKYTDRGSVVVRLSKGEAQRWNITINDSGVGMSSSDVQNLFTPFSRFHAGKVEGVGLGLALSKILVELNQGQISVNSIKNRGSQFSIVLPEADAQLVQSYRQKRSSAFGMPRSPARKKKRVLVVDDDRDAVLSLSRTLEREGFGTLGASTVGEAIALINFEKPDLVITDLGMPEGGGRRLLKFMQEHGIETACLVLTGSDTETERATLLALGATQVLLKPIETGTLLALVHDLTSHAKRSDVLVA